MAYYLLVEMVRVVVAQLVVAVELVVLLQLLHLEVVVAYLFGNPGVVEQMPHVNQ
jgi:hypothetical protein